MKLILAAVLLATTAYAQQSGSTIYLTISPDEETQICTNHIKGYDSTNSPTMSDVMSSPGVAKFEDDFKPICEKIVLRNYEAGKKRWEEQERIRHEEEAKKDAADLARLHELGF